MKTRRSISKHDMRRALEGLLQHSQIVGMRLDDIERVLQDYIEFQKEMESFKKFIDGKYKQKERKRSGKSTTSSSE
tara:strand:+ start:2025 stop:2252 length:228 start_codon:yes stop_codon:yes gene_type:complete